MWVADMDFESPTCIKNALRKYVDNGIFGYHSEPKELRDILAKDVKFTGDDRRREIQPKACATAFCAISESHRALTLSRPTYSSLSMSSSIPIAVFEV